MTPARFVRFFAAVAVVGGPLGYLVGGVLTPSIHDTAQASIASNAAANGVTNGIHLAAFVFASLLLPTGAIALASLAYPSQPWLATMGGVLAVLGWAPLSALTALDDLTLTIASLGDRDAYATLLDRFSTDAVMTTYLMIYIVGHLAAYILLGTALLRGSVIPRWAAWSLIMSSPVTVAAFILPGSPRLIGALALSLLVLGSLPTVEPILLGKLQLGPNSSPHHDAITP